MNRSLIVIAILVSTVFVSTVSQATVIGGGTVAFYEGSAWFSDTSGAGVYGLTYQICHNRLKDAVNNRLGQGVSLSSFTDCHMAPFMGFPGVAQFRVPISSTQFTQTMSVLERLHAKYNIDAYDADVSKIMDTPADGRKK